MRSPWLPYPRREGHVGARLFCLPHAGAGASAFREWVRADSSETGRTSDIREVPDIAEVADIEVCPIQPPGRETRHSQPHYGEISALIPELAEALLPELDLPYAVFGNSAGAVIAFELARRLESEPGPHRRPSRLIVAASAAPWHAASLLPPLGLLSDDELVDLVAGRFGGIPAMLLDAPHLLAQFVPTLRRDLAATQRYRAPSLPALSCPVTALVGEDDPVPRDFVDQWRAVTVGPFELISMPGGHFAPLRHARAVIDLTRMVEI